MARTFNKAPVPFIGNFTPKPISLCRKTDEEPSSVTLEIPWTLNSSIGAGVYDGGAVQVDLTVQGPANPIKKIRSLVIDNTAVGQTVYIQFPDTIDVITVLPNSLTRVAVLTDALQFKIFTPDFFTVDDGSPITRILCTNVMLEPLVEREIDTAVQEFVASNSLTFETKYQPAGLGDATIQSFKNMGGIGTVGVLPAQTQGSYIIRNINVYTYGMYSTTNVLQQDLFFETLAGTEIFEINFLVMPDLSRYGRQKIYEKVGVNLVLSATSGYRLRNTVASGGVAEINVDYTYTPILPTTFN